MRNDLRNNLSLSPAQTLRLHYPPPPACELLCLDIPICNRSF